MLDTEFECCAGSGVMYRASCLQADSVAVWDWGGRSRAQVKRVFASGASKYAFTTLSHTLCSLLLVASKDQWLR